ncbi:uncharacterized protein LOC126671347 [Mercurialis annua]|uniref:uncharacterized protein LOC126671347 n=1 Tax=Mercurialis annua TaxID=3986 RepID=UPI00215FF6B8|nr:uncharacterized protein LOC126671347 [Mercurialis annua]
MEAQEFMELFDSYWFEAEIFKKQLNSSKSSDFDENQAHQLQETPQKPEIYRAPSILSRSMSDIVETKTSFTSGFSLSPDSVLHSEKLQTILSGKEISEQEEGVESSVAEFRTEPVKKSRNYRRKFGRKTLSKSLSELEFEELQGFMDLGFVFSEEDNKDSELVSIIPGLQRFGRKDQAIMEETGVSRRPYLSEAWKVLEEPPLMNLRITGLSNEIDMKDKLKLWAHSVASTVR